MCALVKRVQRDDVGHNRCMGTLGRTMIGSGIDIVASHTETGKGNREVELGAIGCLVCMRVVNRTGLVKHTIKGLFQEVLDFYMTL
ncbi:PREDICTED: PRUPE_6G163600 [Prunus dulcis]|uniref:PREDICTED: PRUPE_6G163600 n=1 Tax=Prunus dulcis TaxID=3755 RepID=A0A5E4GL13_PRUDU|nr:PREDICTED: PRUPE_6G163600 [Prunus dulcis]